MAEGKPEEKPGRPPRKAARGKASPRATAPGSEAALIAPAGPEQSSQEIAELERLRARLVTKFTGRR